MNFRMFHDDKVTFQRMSHLRLGPHQGVLRKQQPLDGSGDGSRRGVSSESGDLTFSDVGQDLVRLQLHSSLEDRQDLELLWGHGQK